MVWTGYLQMLLDISSHEPVSWYGCFHPSQWVVRFCPSTILVLPYKFGWFACKVWSNSEYEKQLKMQTNNHHVPKPTTTKQSKQKRQCLRMTTTQWCPSFLSFTDCHVIVCSPLAHDTNSQGKRASSKVALYVRNENLRNKLSNWQRHTEHLGLNNS